MPKSMQEFCDETSANKKCRIINFYRQSKDKRIDRSSGGDCAGLTVSWLCKVAKHGLHDATYFWKKSFQTGEEPLPKAVAKVMKWQGEYEVPMLGPFKYMKEKSYLQFIPFEEGSMDDAPVDSGILCKALAIQNTVSLIMLPGTEGGHAVGGAHLRASTFQFYDPNFGEVEFYDLDELGAWIKGLLDFYAGHNITFSSMYVLVFKVK